MTKTDITEDNINIDDEVKINEDDNNSIDDENNSVNTENESNIENEENKKNNLHEEELEGVLGSILLGSIVGIFFGFLIGYYKENYLLGFLIAISISLISSAYFEYFIFENLVQLNYYRVLLGLQPIEPLFKGVAKGFKSLGKGIAGGFKSLGQQLASMGSAAIKAIVKKVLEPMFKGVKGVFEKEIKNTLLSPLKMLEGLLKKMIDGVKKAASGVVYVAKKIASFMKKMPKIFEAFGKGLLDSIVIPMLNVFKSFGLIILAMLEFLFIPIQKIISIPRCIGVYLYHGISFFMNNILIHMLPNWLKGIYLILVKFIKFLLKIIYNIFYITVYPLRIFGWDMVSDITNFFKSDCMTVNFKKPREKMISALTGLVPKFKPIKIDLF